MFLNCELNKLLNYLKRDTRHLPLIERLALARLLHLFHQLTAAVLAHLGMLLEQLVDELLIDNGVAMNETVTFATYTHDVVGIVGAVHARGHYVVELHVIVINGLAAVFTFAPPHGCIATYGTLACLRHCDCRAVGDMASD